MLGWIVPASDISRAIGMEHKVVQNVIKRNEKQFEPFSTTTLITRVVPGTGAAHTICLSRDGVTMLLMKLQPDRMADQVLAEKVSRFQIEVVRSFGAIMDGTIQGAPALPTWDQAVASHLNMAELMVKFCHVDPGIAQAKALSEAEKETGRDLTGWKAMLPPATAPTGYLTPTLIGDLKGWKPWEVNTILATRGLQEKIYKTRPDGSREYDWKLTDEGEKYGKMFPFERNGHSGYQIRWTEQVLALIPRRPTQAELAAFTGMV